LDDVLERYGPKEVRQIERRHQDLAQVRGCIVEDGAASRPDSEDAWLDVIAYRFSQEGQ
jgi:hypothetical protein